MLAFIRRVGCAVNHHHRHASSLSRSYNRDSSNVRSCDWWETPSQNRSRTIEKPLCRRISSGFRALHETPVFSDGKRSVGEESRRRYVSDEMKKNMANELVWIDMEMTGLDVDNCHILEVACLITDSNLQIISQNFDVVINQPEGILTGMNEWCVKHHAMSGLTDASRASKVSLKDAERLVLSFISAHVPKGKCPMAGNSIYMDRLFLRKYMPQVDEYLHYRVVDVSTVKELARRWAPKVAADVPHKQLNHRALDDIRESINELRYYKCNFFST